MPFDRRLDRDLPAHERFVGVRERRAVGGGALLVPEFAGARLYAEIGGDKVLEVFANSAELLVPERVLHFAGGDKISVCVGKAFARHH